jgi:hypothetical protein
MQDRKKEMVARWHVEAERLRKVCVVEEYLGKQIIITAIDDYKVCWANIFKNLTNNTFLL